MPSELKGKRILVTGSTGSFGPYLTDYLADEGAEVIGTYISEERRKGDYITEPDRKSEAEVRAGKSDKISYYEVDLSSPDEVASLRERIEKEHGEIDGIVNLVGNYMLGDIDVADKQQFETTFEVHVTTVFLIVKEFAGHLERNGGSVVNMASVSVLNPKKGALSFLVSKGALCELTKVLNVELENVQVNAVMPFRIDLPGNREAFPDEDFDEWTKPEEVTDTIKYLLTNEAVNGNFIRV